MQQWISIKDELPVNYDWILISFVDESNESLRFVPSVGEYRNGKWATKEDDAAYSDLVRSYDFEKDFHVKVTHWMPLPEPPK